MVSVSREPDQKVIARWALCSGCRASGLIDTPHSDRTMNAITRGDV